MEDATTLFISGGAAKFSLSGSHKSDFLRERLRRLGIPLLLGTLFLIPPQVFIENIHSVNGFLDIYPYFIKEFFQNGKILWHHLWFLAYLLIYSFIVYYSEFFFQTSQIRKIFINPRRKRQILLTPPILLLSTQLLLRPYFPTDTHALYNDLANFTYYMIFYFMGFLFFIYDWNIYFYEHIYEILFICVLSTISLFYWYYNLIDYRTEFSGEVRLFIKYGIKSFMGWFWTALIIGWGYKYLNYEIKFLGNLQESIYPFYVLHQTIIVVIGYWLLTYNFNLYLQYLSIVLITLALSMAISVFFIQKINFLRFCFGLKQKK